MLDFARHIVRISAMRDKTEANRAMAEAMQELFEPRALALGRCFTSRKGMVVFTSAGIGPAGVFSRNAYLPHPDYCTPIEDDPVLNRCRETMSAVSAPLPGGFCRAIFPIIRHDHLLYVIDVALPEDFPPERRVLMMGLVEYFGNHIALLDDAETDTLTGLANRKTFDKHLFDILGQAPVDTPENIPHRRHGATDEGGHWLAICDIDHFKRINDDYGHLIGDEVLVVLSQMMRQCFRFDDQLFRFGGEEFIIVLQPTTQKSALQTLERFRKTVGVHLFGQIGHATISIGFSRLLSTDTPSDVIDRADQALYYAKQHGRNQTALYEELVQTGEVTPQPVHRGVVELF